MAVGTCVRVGVKVAPGCGVLVGVPVITVVAVRVANGVWGKPVCVAAAALVSCASYVSTISLSGLGSNTSAKACAKTAATDSGLGRRTVV